MKYALRKSHGGYSSGTRVEIVEDNFPDVGKHLVVATPDPLGYADFEVKDEGLVKLRDREPKRDSA